MANIKITALGGLGENGKNMYIVEVDELIFILDAGLKYPDIDMYGVDAVVPDLSYLIQNKDRIAGIFVSHGHEDNIGAIPYILRNIQTNVYGTHFTISLIETLLVNNKMDIKKFRLYRINETKVLNFKNVKVKFFNTSHSIPESVGIALYTEDGIIVYATDFNFMPTTEVKYQTSFSKLTDFGKEKVLALMVESVGTSAIGRISNDMLLEHNYNNALTHASSRMVVAAYSSDLIRIQKIIDLSIAKGRKIALVAHKGEKVVETAILNNYLRIPNDSFVKTEDIENVDQDNLVVIVHGKREETYTMLVRMALGEDKLLTLHQDDQIILICPPVSGTERIATDAINTLYRNGFELTIYDKDVLRSSHASRDDLKLIFNMVKPEYIIPIKGEYRHLYEAMLIAKESGYERSHVLLLDNGEVVNFESGKRGETTKVKVGDIFVDGSLIGDVNEDVIKEREALSTDGAVIMNIYYDLRQRKVVEDPIITSKGIVGQMSNEELVNKISVLAKTMFENALWKKNYSLEDTKSRITEEVTKQLFRSTRHRPLVIIVPIDVNNLVTTQPVATITPKKVVGRNQNNKKPTSTYKKNPQVKIQNHQRVNKNKQENNKKETENV